MREAPALIGYVDGLARWSATPPAEPGAGPPVPAARPAPQSLPPNERRRAPDAVLLALAAAEAAVADAGADARTLPSVFTSAHGDLPLLDTIARTLATGPALLSPTRFHHSVHNAASGYWGIAAGSQAASTALAGGHGTSFGAGLLEALALMLDIDGAVLLAGCDTAATGPLRSVNASRGLVGVALVLAPRPGPRTRWRMTARLVPRTTPQRTGRDGTAALALSEADAAFAHNGSADALALHAALQEASREVPLEVPREVPPEALREVPPEALRDAAHDAAHATLHDARTADRPAPPRGAAVPRALHLPLPSGALALALAIERWPGAVEA